MGLKEFLSRYIDIIESNRSWREMIPISGLLRSRKNICYICGQKLANMYELAEHYRQHHSKERTSVR